MYCCEGSKREKRVAVGFIRAACVYFFIPGVGATCCPHGATIEEGCPLHFSMGASHTDLGTLPIGSVRGVELASRCTDEGGDLKRRSLLFLGISPGY